MLKPDFCKFLKLVMLQLFISDINKGEKEKRASYSHRTATTTYPCYLPILGDSVGAGRTRLTRDKVNH